MNKINHILLMVILIGIWPLGRAWSQDAYVDPEEEGSYSTDSQGYGDINTDTGINDETANTDEAQVTDEAAVAEEGPEDVGLGPISNVAACPLNQSTTNYNYNYNYDYGTSSDYGYGNTSTDYYGTGTTVPVPQDSVGSYYYEPGYAYTYTVPSYYYNYPVVVYDYPIYSSFFYPGQYYTYRSFNSYGLWPYLFNWSRNYYHGGYWRHHPYGYYGGRGGYYYGRWGYPYNRYYGGLTRTYSPSSPWWLYSGNRFRGGYARGYTDPLLSRSLWNNRTTRTGSWPGNRNYAYGSGTQRYLTPRSGIAQRQYLDSRRGYVPRTNWFNRQNLNDSGMRRYIAPRSGIAQRPYLDSRRTYVPRTNQFNRPNLNDSGTRRLIAPRSGMMPRQYLNSPRSFRPGVNRPAFNDGGTRLYRSPGFNTVRPFRDSGTRIAPRAINPMPRQNFSSPVFRPPVSRSFSAPRTFAQPRFNPGFSRGPAMRPSFQSARPSFHSGGGARMGGGGRVGGRR